MKKLLTVFLFAAFLLPAGASDKKKDRKDGVKDLHP